MSIDSLYEGIISKLTKQNKIVDISKELLSITSNDERVLYVYYLIRDLECFPSVIEVHKTQNVSTYYRNRGNEYFQKSEDFIAWQYYNLSLLHAPSHSDHYVLALANRSAVFFSMKQFEECIKDITKVFSMKYPGRLKEKLSKRQSACEEALAGKNRLNENGEEEANATISDILMMEGPKDERYLCASSTVKVVCNQEMGRHVVAKEDIKVGDILAQEDPYLCLVLKSQLLFSCSYCLSRNLNLLPCDNCCFGLYCSEKCKEKAWQEYHKTECLLMPTLIHMDFTKLEMLALRTVIKARTDHKDWHSLFNTIAKAEAFQNTEYRGCVKMGEKWVFDSKYYTSIHTLASNIEKRTISDIFQKSVTAAVFLKLLGDATDFINCDDDVERAKIRRCVGGTLLLHIMTSPTNMHGLSSNMETKQGNFVDEISMASAPYAFHSLLNHSCAPNVVRFSKLGTSKITLFALRPIKKGMQLFDNYGSHHALEDREKRQANLKFQYKFSCLCEACVNDWPTYLFLEPARNLPTKIKKRKNKLLSDDTIERLQKGDRGKALEIFKPLCNLAEELEAYAPCKELADCQESLKQCLVILEGTVPYGFSKVVKWNAIPPEV